MTDITDIVERLRWATYWACDSDEGGWQTRNDTPYEAADAIEALRAENARLREALKPFADEAVGLTDEYDDWPINYKCGDSVVFTFGQLRAARAAMGESD